MDGGNKTPVFIYVFLQKAGKLLCLVAIRPEQLPSVAAVAGHECCVGTGRGVRASDTPRPEKYPKF